MEEINLKEFWNYYKRYLVFVILVITICGSLMALYTAFVKKPMYSTSTTIVLAQDAENTIKGDTINQSDVTLNQKLISTYTQIIKSRLVLNQVIEKLKLDYSVDNLSGRVSVSALDDTAIIKVTITDADPEQATKIANTIATVFGEEVKKLYNIDNVNVMDKALEPTKPSNIHVIKDTLIAAVVGFVVSSAIVFVIFYFDDVIRDTDTLENEMKLPILAKVFKSPDQIDLIVNDRPNAAASESIRNLRTNLQFSSVDEEVKSILVASSIPSEGKSFVSANLAISFAQAGKKVLLVDCDLRKGRQHKIFGVSGRKGLSNLLIGDISTYSDYIAKTSIKNLSVLPRGTFPPNPSELLNSKKNAKLIEILRNRFDIVVLDGAPIAGLSDSLILSTVADKTLLVTSINRTPKTDLINSKKALENVGANLAGIVANNVSTKRGTYGGYYYYYGYSDEPSRKVEAVELEPEDEEEKEEVKAEVKTIAKAEKVVKAPKKETNKEEVKEDKKEEEKENK